MPTSNTSDLISIHGIPLLIPDRPGNAGNFKMWNSKLYDYLKSQKDIHLAANLLNPQLVNGVLIVDRWLSLEIPPLDASQLAAGTTEASLMADLVSTRASE
jgi:hypothetical protein